MIMWNTRSLLFFPFSSWESRGPGDLHSPSFAPTHHKDKRQNAGNHKWTLMTSNKNAGPLIGNQRRPEKKTERFPYAYRTHSEGGSLP